MEKKNVDFQEFVGIVNEMGWNDSFEQWKGSPLEKYIRGTIPATRGKDVEKKICQLLEKKGFENTHVVSNRAGYDIEIFGKRIEIKYASIGKTKGFTFDQVRVNDDRYEGILFVAIHPHDIEYYYATKSELDNLTKCVQHSGQKNCCTINMTTKNREYFKTLTDGSLDAAIEKMQE